MFSVAPTPFDVRLVAFGIPIRVHPTFWLSMILLGWNLESPRFIFLWVVCGFVSVLIHELGHAVMSEWYGWPTEIVLYFGGGVAMSQRYQNVSHWRNIVVSLMGPVAGFLLLLQVVIVWALLKYNHVALNYYVKVTLEMLVFQNLFWNLLNLIPVLPLDGGRVVQSICEMTRLRDPVGAALKIGVAASGICAYVLLVRWHQEMPGILMAVFCLQNVAALQDRRYR